MCAVDSGGVIDNGRETMNGRVFSKIAPPAFGAVLAVCVLAVAPPSRGTLLAVPLGTVPAHRLLALPGMRLRGPGPWPGSLVVEARDAPFGAALADRILLLSGDGRSCSTGDRK